MHLQMCHIFKTFQGQQKPDQCVKNVERGRVREKGIEIEGERDRDG